MTEVPARSVLSVPAMEIAPNAVNDLPMETAVLAQSVVEIDHPTETEAPVRSVPSVQVMVTVRNAANVGETDHPMVVVLNVPALATAEVVQTALVHLVVAMTALHVGKSQNSLKSSEWLANFVWFVHTTMTPGSMMMSPVMSSTRSHVMS